ncbi:hypothetical protein [Streptomyces sp. NPDC056661]|uniref:hypothetical protein n=1 Tax=Streptomyces sp. NPDC056661 TaxID=3345898 RepID=UPI003682C278
MQQDVEVDLAPRLVVCQLCAAFPQETTGLPRTWLPFLPARGSFDGARSEMEVTLSDASTKYAAAVVSWA